MPSPFGLRKKIGIAGRSSANIPPVASPAATAVPTPSSSQAILIVTSTTPSLTPSLTPTLSNQTSSSSTRTSTSVVQTSNAINSPVSTDIKIASPHESNSAPEGNAESPISSEQLVLTAAISRHAGKISPKKRQAYIDAAENITLESIFDRVQGLEEIHKDRSSMQKCAKPLIKTFEIVDMLMASVTILIQQSPEISSLVVGGLRLILDIGIRFVAFFQRLTEMIVQLGEYLQPLSEIAKSAGNVQFVQDALAAAYCDLLDFCDEAQNVFEDEKGLIRKYTSSRIFLHTFWESFESKFTVIETSLLKHLNVLLHSTQAIQIKRLDEMADDFRKLEGERQRIHSLEKRNERKGFLQWISNVNFEDDHNRIFQKRHENTGIWLLQKPEFQNWLTCADTALLWCHGGPGIGKSVLASIVLDHITTKFAAQKSNGIIFAYYNYQNEQSQLHKAENLVRSFIKQLCWQIVDIPQDVLDFYHLYSEDARDPGLEKLIVIFILLASQFKYLYLVVDALDECKFEQRPHFIQIVTQLSTSHHCAKIFITSRKERDIQNAFERLNVPVVKVEARDIARDISSYINYEVHQRIKENKLKVHDPTLVLDIIQLLNQKAEGMFLWVQLQLENLCLLDHDDHIRQELGSMSTILNETYCTIFKRIYSQPPVLRDLAQRAFNWVFCAMRPLTTAELTDALSIDTKSKRLVEPKYRIDSILQACGNLLTADSDTLVRPIHFSVKEFLSDAENIGLRLSTSRGTEAVAESFRNATTDNTELARSSMLYLTLNFQAGPVERWFDIEDSCEQYPLALYSSKFFDFHIASSSIHSSSSSLKDCLETLLLSNNKHLAAILQFRALDDTLKNQQSHFREYSWPINIVTFLFSTNLSSDPYFQTGDGKRWLEIAPPAYSLCAASLGGSLQVLMKLVETGEDVNEKDPTGVSPLYYVSQRGNVAMCSFLLDREANVNAKGGHYSNALQVASAEGYDKIVSLLLGRGADVNTQGGYFGNALQAASAGGHDKIISLLFNQGADVNAQGGEYCSALQAASYGGHDKTVSLLLDRGADINAQGGYYFNALRAASIEGHDKIVSLLLGRDADVNAQGGHYGNVLQTASAKGHDKIVSLLLDRGADTNAKGGHFGNALQAASARGHDKTVSLLLDRGADVNAQGGYYGNALQAALAEGHDKIISLLLGRGVHVDAQGGHYGNALQAASAEGYDTIVTLLLDRGANVNAQDGKFFNALQAASAKGYDKIVSLLLDRGADVNAQGGHYGNALQAASTRGHDKIVALLFDKGADVNAQCGQYGNALQAASSEGHDKIVSLLLGRGADVNAQGGDYGNALQAASAGGHDKTISLLLGRGAHVNAQGGYYGNALQAASAKGYDKIVTLLLDRGANVNAQDGTFFNALQAASAKGYDRIVSLLLDRGADVNAQGGDYGSALQVASAKGYNKIVFLLVDSGADVNAEGGEYGNALQAAEARGHSKIAALLLGEGAKPLPQSAVSL